MRFEQSYRFVPLPPGIWPFMSILNANMQELDQMQPYIRRIDYNGPAYGQAGGGMISGNDQALDYDLATANSSEDVVRARVLGFTKDIVDTGIISLQSYGIWEMGGTTSQPSQFESGRSWPTAGSLLYLSTGNGGTTSGKITPIKPSSRVVEIGIALDWPYVYFCPRPYISGNSAIR